MASDYILALADYRLTFPDLASLGEGNPPDKWKAEYDRVKGLTFGQTMITSTQMTDGGGASAIKNFDQSVLLSALHARRGELDATYTALTDPVMPTRSLGITVAV